MPAMTCCRDEWLVRMLESRGLVTPAAAVELRSLPYASSGLFSRGLVAPEALAKALWEQYRLTYADPPAADVEKMACQLVPESLCRKHNLLPVRLDGETIEILAANPLDASAMDEVRAASGRSPRPVFCQLQRIESLISELYSTDAVIYDLLKRIPETGAVEFVSSEEESVEPDIEAVRTPVIRLANKLIAQAITMEASDIHIEQEERGTVVRYRIDGVLREVMTIPKHIGNGPLISRIKIMSNLDVADRRRPQDGRAKLRVGAREVGLRVSTIPTACGEKAVLRILEQAQAQVPLAALGFRPEILQAVTDLSACGQGIVLVTGPTGSGKTTTLYAVLNRIRSGGVNIVTVEDPVEYRLPGINQVQVQEKAGMGFAAVLRSVLRQDPDIIFVGEIRDRETADIAFQAALTGHLVFSTLHTNDAFSTINRLLDMGVERFKLAPALRGVISQRLVRRVCQECGGKGCGDCSGEGLRGRVALAELLDLRSSRARTALGASRNAEEFEAAARAEGWLMGMEEDAAWHLSAGETTPEEAAPYLKQPSPAGEAASRPETAVKPPAPAARWRRSWRPHP